jgi:MoxR-like ATPase
MTTVLDAPPARRELDDATAIRRIGERLNTVLRGKADVVQMVLACLLARGHLLLEDRPGLGKTTLAKGLAEAIGGRFSRVQCTPDLLPTDITGFNIFNQKTHEFEFRPGPVFADVMLADEINRTTPRTQSALLEAMAERQVTVDGERQTLSEEFFVIATQNPHEQHGTYPLPEAQLDRFAIKLQIGYPHPDDELKMLGDAITQHSARRESQGSLLTLGHLQQIQERVAGIAVIEPVQRYLVQLAEVSRNHPDISLGLSPRGLLTWLRLSQAWAFLANRDFVTPDDIQDVAFPALSVRLGIDRDDHRMVIDDLLSRVDVPKST